MMKDLPMSYLHWIWLESQPRGLCPQSVRTSGSFPPVCLSVSAALPSPSSGFLFTSVQSINRVTACCICFIMGASYTIDLTTCAYLFLTWLSGHTSYLCRGSWLFSWFLLPELPFHLLNGTIAWSSQMLTTAIETFSPGTSCGKFQALKILHWLTNKSPHTRSMNACSYFFQHLFFPTSNFFY